MHCNPRSAHTHKLTEMGKPNHNTHHRPHPTTQGHLAYAQHTRNSSQGPHPTTQGPNLCAQQVHIPSYRLFPTVNATSTDRPGKSSLVCASVRRANDGDDQALVEVTYTPNRASPQHPIAGDRVTSQTPSWRHDRDFIQILTRPRYISQVSCQDSRKR